MKLLVAKRLLALFCLFLSNKAFAWSNIYFHLAERAEIIIRAKLHVQQKSILNPESKKTYRVPVRLEILELIKTSYGEHPKELELTDCYTEVNTKWDAAGWMKRYQALDGKEVLAFLCKTDMRIPVNDPNKEDTYVPMYFLAPDGGFVWEPSLDSLKAYSAEAAKMVHDCVYAPTPTPVPVPDWVMKAIEKTDFSFIKTAIHRHDNDLNLQGSLEGEKVAIPEKVLRVLRAEAKEDYSNLVQMEAGEMDRDKIDKEEFWDYYGLDAHKTYGPVYLIHGPKGLEVYVLAGGQHGWLYWFVVYDPQKDLASAKPVCVSGRWAEEDEDDNLLKKPYVSFDDINSDGEEALVLEERIHNGTMVNGRVDNYFHIGKDMVLKQVLELETTLLSLNDQYAWYSRTITARAKDELTVTVTLEGGEKSIPIGTMTLRSEGGDTPFKIIQKNCVNGDYKGFMFISEDDEYFR